MKQKRTLVLLLVHCKDDETFYGKKFIKECMMSVVSEVSPEKKGAFENNSLGNNSLDEELKNCWRALK